MDESNMATNSQTLVEWLAAGIALGHLPETIEVPAAKGFAPGMMRFDTLAHVAPVLPGAIARGLYEFGYNSVMSNKKRAHELKTSAALEAWMRSRLTIGDFPCAWQQDEMAAYLKTGLMRLANRAVQKAGTEPKSPTYAALVQIEFSKLAKNPAILAHIKAEWEANEALLAKI